MTGTAKTEVRMRCSHAVSNSLMSILRLLYRIDVWLCVHAGEGIFKKVPMPVIEVPPYLPDIRQDLPIQAFAVWFLISIKYLKVLSWFFFLHVTIQIH